MAGRMRKWPPKVPPQHTWRNKPGENREYRREKWENQIADCPEEMNRWGTSAGSTVFENDHQLHLQVWMGTTLQNNGFVYFQFGLLWTPRRQGGFTKVLPGENSTEDGRLLSQFQYKKIDSKMRKIVLFRLRKLDLYSSTCERLCLQRGVA